MLFRASGLTDIGCVRVSNEDVALIDHDLGLFAVADGMGGHKHGAVAAELACKTLHYYVKCSDDRSDVSWPYGYNFDLSIDGNRLATAVQLANRHVWRRAEQDPEYAGMGSTLAAVLAHEDSAVVANVGDSRVYLFRDGALEQLTLDDTWVAEMRRRGGFDSQRLQNSQIRNVLTQAAGSGESLVVHLRQVELLPGDTLLLSTDGLHGVIGDERMKEILSAGSEPEEAVTRLVGAARLQGGPDNIGCVIVRCGG